MKYILNQLSQVSSWIGIILIAISFIAPRWAIAVFGVLLFVSNDEELKAWVAKRAPGLTKWLSDLVAKL